MKWLEDLIRSFFSWLDPKTPQTPVTSATPMVKKNDPSPANIVRPKTKVDFVGRFKIALESVDISSLVGQSRNITINAMMSVAAFESAWAGLTSQGIYTKTNNLFSIKKGSSWRGPTYNDFRIYDSWVDSIKDFVALMNKPYYKTAKALILKGDGKGYFAEIKRLGYDASDPKYAEHLLDTSKAISAFA